MSEWSKLKVTELKSELKKRGLSTAGLKADLVARLESVDQPVDSPQIQVGPPQHESDHGEEGKPSTALDTHELVTESQQLSAASQDEVSAPVQAQEPLSAPQSQEAPLIAESKHSTEAAAEPEPELEPSAPGMDVDPPTVVPEIPGAPSAADAANVPDVAPSVIAPPLAPPFKLGPSASGSASVIANPSTPVPEQISAALNTSRSEAVPETRESGKRKRRSASPAPSTHEPKRSRTDELEADGADVGALADSHHNRSAVPEPEHAQQAVGLDADVVKVVEETQDRVIPPSLHAPTAALYIKDFLRPIHMPELKTHLAELAAGPGDQPDEGVIVECFLDNVRTHGFFLFSSVDAAQRVRNLLHDTVFPKENNRKPLWVDFVPVGSLSDWIAREEREPRGSGIRFEVAYDMDDDNGGVTARLVEIDVSTSSSHAVPNAPQPPTGPRSQLGVEGAPLAPRGDRARASARGKGDFSEADGDVNGDGDDDGDGDGGGGVSGNVGDRDTADGGHHIFRVPLNFPGAYPAAQATRTNPPLYWKPVPEEMAARRLENMNRFVKASVHISDDDRRNGINRYFFEDGESFVDRGKEIFAGIRPPHRERQHRQMLRDREVGSGANNGYGSQRLADLSRRGGIPAPQSFRPGSDRYRGDSYSPYSNSSRYDDRRYRDNRPRASRRN